MFNVICAMLYLLASFRKSDPFIAFVDPTFAPYFVAGTTVYLICRFGSNLLLWVMLAVSVAMTVPSLEQRVAPIVRAYPISYQVALVIIFILFGLMIRLSLTLALPTHRLVERPLARFLRRGLKTSLARVRAAEPVAAGAPRRSAPQRGSDPTFARSLEPTIVQAEETADA